MKKYITYFLLALILIVGSLSFRVREEKNSAEKITDYKILSSVTKGYLEDQVKSHIKKGWKPFGGLSTSKDDYCQAMVKYDAE